MLEKAIVQIFKSIRGLMKNAIDFT